MTGEEPLEGIHQRLEEYRAIQGALNEEKGAMFQAVDRGRQLLKGVSCPALEVKVAEFADQWVTINNNTSQQLRK